MSHDDSGQWITPTTGAKTLPSIEILTGRGFITGKSGSGKSNSASVIAEELLEYNYNLLIVDPEGEYYGLKEKYELLHVGNSDICDVEVGAQHAEKIAEIALAENLPVILDVSDFLDGEAAKELISGVVEELYRLEKDFQKPFLLMVEEMQEYLPQSGGSDDLATLLERVAKRGRKRGLGMLGMSQRPSSVDKDFITQCDWMVWHRLTWKNDLGVVKNILGNEKGAQIEDFDTGEGFLMTDWDDVVERVQFKKKRTHDAGATPGLESYERPDLKSVGDELIAEFNQSGSVDSESPAPEGTGDTTPSTPPAPTPESTSAPDLEEAMQTVDTSIDVEEMSTSDGPAQAVENSLSNPPDLYDDESLERDLETMEEDELREFSRSLQRQNSILSDEITELRSILAEVERDDTATNQSTSQSTAGTAPEQSISQPATNGAGQSPSMAQHTGPTPPRPRPPERPQDRSGLAGNLVEFAEFLIYLFQMAVFKIRSSIRRTPRESDSAQSR